MISYRIEHRTTYTYDSDVTGSHGLFHLRPRDLEWQSCLAHEIAIDPEPADLFRHIDLYGNTKAYFHVIKPHTRLVVTSISMVDIGVKVAGALETAHRRGTLHRDVKPANILLTEYGEPQLTDFGIARIIGGFETADGAVMGSPAYTAPEVIAGEPPSSAADVYGLGATLFAAITGHAAFERRSGDAAGISRLSEGEQHARAAIFADMLHGREGVRLGRAQPILIAKLDDRANFFVQRDPLGRLAALLLTPMRKVPAHT